MMLSKMFTDMFAQMVGHYKFSKPPLEARIVVLEEMIDMLCHEIDELKLRSSNDGK